MMKAVSTAVREVWEVVRVLGVGWQAASRAPSDRRHVATRHRSGKREAPRLQELAKGRSEGSKDQVAALAGMLRLRGLGRFRASLLTAPSQSAGVAVVGASEGAWEVVMPRARDVLRFLFVE